MTSTSFWETKYASGHSEKYPWDHIVSFLLRFYSNYSGPAKPQLLEVGCGTGNNLLFASNEGFDVFGIDISPTAIQYSKTLLSEAGSDYSLHVGSFLSLPYRDNMFDVVVDRCSLTCVDISEQYTAIKEILRCLKPGGLFHYSSYGFDHPSRIGASHIGTSLYSDIKYGNLSKAGNLSFLTTDQIYTLFGNEWKIHSFLTSNSIDQVSQSLFHQEHRLILQKTSSND